MQTFTVRIEYDSYYSEEVDVDAESEEEAIDLVESEYPQLTPGYRVFSIVKRKEAPCQK